MKENKQRYISFNLITEKGLFFEKQEIQKALWKSIWRFFGIKVANTIGLWITEYDKTKKTGIIRCSHVTKEIVITALTMMKSINKKEIIINPIKTSGTIKSIKKGS